MTDPLVRVENLAKVYRSGTGDLVVFEDVSFELQRGESVALVGESGSGKTTLLSSGSDPELSEFRNRRIGYVWQNYHLLPEFTALENVMMPLLIGGEDNPQAEPRAREQLAAVGLAERAGHQAGELSGGEQQRVAIARALVTSPRMLLADEPTGNLDQNTAEKVIDVILSLPASHGVTVLMATHNLTFAQRCDRILRIEARRVVAAALGD
jgi:lipoprotein-releasing system ATP-binding protein